MEIERAAVDVSEVLFAKYSPQRKFKILWRFLQSLHVSPSNKSSIHSTIFYLSVGNLMSECIQV